MMGVELICKRCGNPMRLFTGDMYGRICMTCKKNDVPPTEEEKENFNRWLEEKHQKQGK